MSWLNEFTTTQNGTLVFVYFATLLIGYFIGRWHEKR